MLTTGAAESERTEVPPTSDSDGVRIKRLSLEVVQKCEGRGFLDFRFLGSYNNLEWKSTSLAMDDGGKEPFAV